MREVMVHNLTLPKLSLEEIFKAEGADYSKRPPRQSTIDLHQKILREAPNWIQPKAFWCEVEIKGTEGSLLYLEGGKALDSVVLTKVAGTGDKLVVFAVTLGAGIENGLAQYRDSGKVSESFCLDAIGTAYLTKMIDEFVQYLEGIYQSQGLKTSFPLGPGHSYWKGLEDLQVLFYFLESEKFDLSLNPSNLIIPRKSVGLVIGVGDDIPDTKGKTHCNFCNLQGTCPLSTAT